MKKVKIMLLSLLVWAVVGGTLAFKVKFGNSYCTTPADANTCRFNARTCPNFVTNSTISEGTEACTTTPRPGAASGKDCRTADAAGAANLPCTTTKADLDPGDD